VVHTISLDGQPAPIPSPDGYRPPEQLGLFRGLPGVLRALLPPSVGGPTAANDLETGEIDGGPAEDDEAPPTVRDPGEWVSLQDAPDRVG
jgi:hypothetical protein